MKQTSYSNPSSISETNWEAFRGPGNGFFAEMATDPSKTKTFQEAMSAYTKFKMFWVDFYPTQNLIQDARPNRAILVDVGGGEGNDMRRFREKHTDLPAGSLVLQDLPLVIGMVLVEEPVEVMDYDFFTPQPIKGKPPHL